MSSKIEDMKDERVPACLYWTVDDVANWIESIGFPDYKECFVSNFINGRSLICADASALPRIGITDFQHILTITESIRNLLTIEKLRWDRSISEAPRGNLAANNWKSIGRQKLPQNSTPNIFLCSLHGHHPLYIFCSLNIVGCKGGWFLQVYIWRERARLERNEIV